MSKEKARGVHPDLPNPGALVPLSMTHDDVARQVRLDVLAIASHDLRNPLGSVFAGTALLAKLDVPPPLDEKLRRYVAIVERAAGRMTRWLGDALDLAEVESGKCELFRAPVTARELLDEAVAAVAPAAAEAGLELQAVIDDDPGALAVDRARIVRVLTKLIENAIAATPPGGQVTVSVARPGGVPTFAVRDAGPGVTAEHTATLSDGYWEARRRPGGGNGLGLALAHSLVEAHGGRLVAESAPGKGAIFSFTLPRAP
jgi:signal transduction histidine kinase